MSKLTDFYLHKEALEKKNEPIEAQWETLEDQLIREELLPELANQLKTTLSKVKSPLALAINYDPKGMFSISFSRNCLHTFAINNSTVAPVDTAEEPAEQDKEGQEDGSDIDVIKKTSRAKSIGFTVTFRDGTVYHEKKAVQTWILALKKIGLETICNNRSKHEAWHRVDGQDICIVERTETKRSSGGNSPQTLVDGFYVMTQLSNEQKEKDLLALGKYMPQLGIKIIWDESPEDSNNIGLSQKPVINKEASEWNLPIKIQFQSFMVRKITEGTARSYLRTLDNAVRQYINAEVDANADSIFSYTTSEDVRLCIGILKTIPAFVKENTLKHNSMSAALNQYLTFIEEWEKK